MVFFSPLFNRQGSWDQNQRICWWLKGQSFIRIHHLVSPVLCSLSLHSKFGVLQYSLDFLLLAIFLGVSESICSVLGLCTYLLPGGILKGSEDTPSNEVIKQRCWSDKTQATLWKKAAHLRRIKGLIVGIQVRKIHACALLASLKRSIGPSHSWGGCWLRTPECDL